jgi:hypothetical protein
VACSSGFQAAADPPPAHSISIHDLSHDDLDAHLSKCSRVMSSKPRTRVPQEHRRRRIAMFLTRTDETRRIPQCPLSGAKPWKVPVGAQNRATPKQSMGPPVNCFAYLGTLPCAPGVCGCTSTDMISPWTTSHYQAPKQFFRNG